LAKTGKHHLQLLCESEATAARESAGSVFKVQLDVVWTVVCAPILCCSQSHCMVETATAPTHHSNTQDRAGWLTDRGQAALIAIALVGIFLRCWQYWANDSYFMDEVAVLRNLVDRSWRELFTQPLSYGQTAPPGFLVLEKLLAGTSGATEYSLR
jgi:hypothetical protein